MDHMLRTKRDDGVGYLSSVAGTTMSFGGFIPHVVLFMASFALMTIWFVWSPLVLRSEEGPAFVRWGAGSSRTSERHAT